MKVVLLKEVGGLGEEDDVCNVSEGYARNFLFPRKLAVKVTDAVLAAVEKRKDEKEKKLAAKRAEFSAIANTLSEQEVLIEAEAGEGGKLFGVITAQDIAQAINKTCQIEVDKRKIDLAAPLKMVGEHVVLVKLYQGITANVKVKIIAK